MRTTLTLDDDVAAKLKTLARRTGRPFEDVVNTAIRNGLLKPPVSSPLARFTVHARDLGALKPGLRVDNISELLEQVEGPLHR